MGGCTICIIVVNIQMFYNNYNVIKCEYKSEKTAWMLEN